MSPKGASTQIILNPQGVGSPYPVQSGVIEIKSSENPKNLKGLKSFIKDHPVSSCSRVFKQAHFAVILDTLCPTYHLRRIQYTYSTVILRYSIIPPAFL